MPRHVFVFAALLTLPALHGPARAEKNLTRPPGTTRYAALVRRLTALRDYDQSHHKRLTLTTIGASVKGRSLWLVTLSANPAGAKSILYVCRQHGHEPASTEGAVAFLDALVKADDGSVLVQSLQEATVYVVPMANPDGSEAFLRHNARDVDLNRDWLRRTQPETRALYQAILRLHPDFVTDQHELYPNDTHPDFTEVVGAGSGAGAALIYTLGDVQALMQGVMQAEGFPTGRYVVTDTHPARLAHRWVSLKAGIPTVLFETRRLNGTGRSVQSRAEAHTEFMRTMLRYAAGDRDGMAAEAQAWRDAHAAPPTVSSPVPSSDGDTKDKGTESAP